MKRNVISDLIILIIVVVLLFVGLNITKNRIILFKVKTMLKDNSDMNNYSYTITSCEFGSSKTLATSTYYVMGQNFSAKITNNFNDSFNSIISYKDEDDEIILANINGDKYYKINDETNFSTGILSAPSNFKQFSESLIFQIEKKVDQIITTERNEKKCYLVTTKDGGNYWIEKDTGIVISYIENNYLYNLEYSIGDVISSDLVKPDTTEYLN